MRASSRSPAASRATWLALALVLGTSGCAGRDAGAPRLADVVAAGGPLVRTLRAEDGGSVSADEYGAGERGVVLAHGGRFDKESWRPQAEVLARAGFRVVAIDFRGYGASRAGSAPDDEGYALDVLAAVRHLRATGATQVAVVGGSFGGWASAEAAIEAAPGEIDRLVLLASSPIAEPERLPGRKLFVIARDDPRADGSPRLTAFREQFERAPGPKGILILDGDAHAQFLFETDQGPRLLEAIRAFLAAP